MIKCDVKRTRSAVILCMIAALLLLTAAACDSRPAGDPSETATEVPEVTPTPLPEDISEQTDYVTQTWIATDISFETDHEYETREQLYVEFFADFTNRATGTVLSIPGFWNGDSTFVIRFAPTEYGIWDFRTRCEGDASLDGRTGTVAANPYRGDLDIYKHGFVKTNGTKHFVYADGTPFFYLGDTHWNMYSEEINRGGPHAGDTGAESHFKYIVDKRVEQGFTVYQSEPIGTKADLTDGSLANADVRAFVRNDEYYQYIAEKGLVHANAEFCFVTDLTGKAFNNDAYLEAISRYWVARYGAYPVMWTLAQKCDNDYYYEDKLQKLYDYTENPWVKIAEYIHKYDAYGHPLSGHQENTGHTTVTGAGTGDKVSGNGQSAFLSDEVTLRTGHDWWAAQWSPKLTGLPDKDLVKDYWNSSKVAVNYEGRYCNLWTKDFGARAQSWIAMLSGFSGVGYGAADIWLYQSSYDVNTTSKDGIDIITPEDKAVWWSKAVEFESAYQQGYMRRFFEQFNWWDLTPDFGDEVYFVPKSESTLSVTAAIGSELRVTYFYSLNTETGTVTGLDGNSVYEAKWFNPRTNEYVDLGTFKTDENVGTGAASWDAPERTEELDFVLVVKKAG